MEIFGRAAWYRIDSIFIEMPIKMPLSNGHTRHATNVTNPGIRSVSINKNQFEIYQMEILFCLSKKNNSLLLRHIGFTTRTSTMKITAAIIIDASAALGM